MKEQIIESLKLSPQDQELINQYPDQVLKKSFEITKRNAKDRNKLVGYFFKVCKTEYGRYLTNPSQYETRVPVNLPRIEPKSTRPLEPYQQPMTAFEIAEEIAKIKAIDANTGFNGKPMFGGEGYKLRMLANWCEKDYVASEDKETENIALMYIKSVKEILQKSNTTKEKELNSQEPQTKKNI